jgi:hypothetical protein
MIGDSPTLSKSSCVDERSSGVVGVEVKMSEEAESDDEEKGCVSSDLVGGGVDGGGIGTVDGGGDGVRGREMGRLTNEESGRWGMTGRAVNQG